METIKWQTRAAYGCLVVGPWARAYPMAYRLYAYLSVIQKSAAAAAIVACGSI